MTAPDAARLDAWRDEVAGVLGEHEVARTDYDRVRGREVVVCACGSRHPAYDDGRWPTHEQHRAAALLPLLARIDREARGARARAWNEGVRVGYAHARAEDDAGRTLPLPANPYRADSIAPEAKP